MSDTPFWKQALNDVEGESEPVGSDDVLTIRGHQFIRTEGIAANVELVDDDGTPLGVVTVPYDPDNQPSEDDVFAQASKLYSDLEYMRAVVREDALADLARNIVTSGVADTIIKTAVDTLRGSFRLYLTDDERATMTPAALEEWDKVAREAERLYDEQALELGVRAAVEAKEREDDPAGAFVMDYARDLIAHATIWARDEVVENLGGPEAVEALDDATFERMVGDAYRPYLTQAMLTLWQPWTLTLVKTVAKSSRISDDDPETSGTFQALIVAARKSLGLPEPTTSQTTPVPLTPAFDADGYGRIANDLIAQGTRYMMVAPWPGPRTSPPEFHYRTNAGAVSYGVERALDSLQDAWAVVDRLDDGHADLFDFILAKMFVSMAANSRDVYGDFTVTRAEILDARFKKLKKGGHRPENIREVISQMHDLSQIQLGAELWRHPKSKRGGKPQRVAIEHEVNLIDVHETLYEVTLSGERLPIAWNMRPGNWTRALEGFTEQYALMMHGILKLHGKRDRHAKRIGRYLIAQYRIRAHYQNWAQGYDVRTILDGAGIEIPTRNKPRFKQSIEVAFDTLADAAKMHGPVCIGTWKYSQPIDFSRPDWFECWLDTPVIIMPTTKLMEEQYRGIGAKRRKLGRLASRTT